MQLNFKWERMFKSIRFFAFLLALNSFTLIFAQRASIKGIIVDGETNTALPFVNIGISKGGDAPTGGTISNDRGEFIFEALETGNYQLTVSFIGYQNQTMNNIDIPRANSKVDIGTLQLQVSTIALQGVDVRAMRQTASSKIDRKSYQTSDFETAKGGTAVDVLNKLPSVSVSPDGIVSVRGTEDFMVYLNGKPTQMDPSMLLGQISGDAIQSIDLISVPTAKFDAQGKGGIININTKKDAIKGLSITTNGLLGGAPWGNLTDEYSGFKQNDNRYGGGLNLMYHQDKISYYGGLNFNHKNVNGLRTGDARVLVDSDNDIYRHMVAGELGGERPEWYEYFSANAGFDINLNSYSDISASYFYGKRQEGRSAFYVYDIFYADKDKANKTNEEWIYNPNTDNRYGDFHTANLDYKYRPNEKTSLTVSGLVEFSGLDRKLENLNWDFNRNTNEIGNKQLHYIQSDNTPLKGYRLSIDYSKELENGHILNLGIQPQFFDISGAFNYDTLNTASNTWAAFTSLENSIDLTRGIYAGYVDYEGSVEKLSFIVGLRLEYTDQELNINQPDYFSIFNASSQSNFIVNKLDWFPTLHLNYDFSEINNLTLAASRRISRPPIKNMAPFLYRRHLEVYVVGDPNLKPEYLTNAELSYDHKIDKHSVNVTAFYRGTDHAIFRVNTVTSETAGEGEFDNSKVREVVQEDVLIRSYTNAGNTHAMGAELNANLVAGRFAKFFVGGALYNFRVDSDIFGYKSKNQSTNWSLKANANVYLTKTLTLSGDVNVNSATVTAQGQNDLFYMTNAALSYKPTKYKGWDLTVRVLDLAKSNSTGLDTRAFNSKGEEIFYQETEYLRYGPIVEFGVSYALNTSRLKASKEKKTIGDKEF